MFCEARLSTDCALVKQLQGGIAPLLWYHRSQAFQRPRKIVSGSHAGISKPQQSENTRVYTVPRLDSFWEAMVSSHLPA